SRVGPGAASAAAPPHFDGRQDARHLTHRRHPNAQALCKGPWRRAPSLFGLYTVVAGLYVQLPPRWRRGGLLGWSGKQDVSFADALTAVRRWLWVEWVFAIPGPRTAFSKLSRPFQQLLLAGLTAAA